MIRRMRAADLVIGTTLAGLDGKKAIGKITEIAKPNQPGAQTDAVHQKKGLMSSGKVSREAKIRVRLDTGVDLAYQLGESVNVITEDPHQE